MLQEYMVLVEAKAIGTCMVWCSGVSMDIPNFFRLRNVWLQSLISTLCVG
jgi:hypothetical protein